MQRILDLVTRRDKFMVWEYDCGYPWHSTVAEAVDFLELATEFAGCDDWLKFRQPLSFQVQICWSAPAVDSHLGKFVEFLSGFESSKHSVHCLISLLKTVTYLVQQFAEWKSRSFFGAPRHFLAGFIKSNSFIQMKFGVQGCRCFCYCLLFSCSHDRYCICLFFCCSVYYRKVEKLGSFAITFVLSKLVYSMIWSNLYTCCASSFWTFKQIAHLLTFGFPVMLSFKKKKKLTLDSVV